MAKDGFFGSTGDIFGAFGGVTIKDLQILIVLAETGSITDTAKRLAVCKSTVSKRVGAMSEAFGQSLVHTTTRHVSITDFGLAILSLAESFIDGLKTCTTILDSAPALWVSKLPSSRQCIASAIAEYIDLNSSSVNSAATLRRVCTELVKTEVFTSASMQELIIGSIGTAVSRQSASVLTLEDLLQNAGDRVLVLWSLEMRRRFQADLICALKKVT